MDNFFELNRWEKLMVIVAEHVTCFLALSGNVVCVSILVVVGRPPFHIKTYNTLYQVLVFDKSTKKHG